METCRMCGAGLKDDDELRHHNEQLHPGQAGKKGGDPGTDELRKPDRDRPID